MTSQIFDSRRESEEEEADVEACRLEENIVFILW